jgi:acyl-coenzyme A thioesterase PaaI-like protein
MSAYPPDRHVLRDLRFETQRLAADHVRGFAPRQPGVCAADGSVRISAVTMMVDVAGAAVAIVASSPDWSATADLSYWSARPLRSAAMVCEARLVRKGSSVVVVHADVYDASGDLHALDDHPDLAAVAAASDDLRLAGHARMTFARIPASASASANRIDRSGAATPRQGIHHPGSAFDDPMFDKVGIRLVDAAAGIVECPRSDYIRNSFGTINGGVIGVIAEAATEPAARHASGAPLVARDLQVHYLSQTKVGPARTATRVLRADARQAVADVRIVDAGNDDTVLALATVTLTR